MEVDEEVNETKKKRIESMPCSHFMAFLSTNLIYESNPCDVVTGIKKNISSTLN